MLRSAWPALRAAYTVGEGARHIYRPSWITLRHPKKGPACSFSTAQVAKYTPLTVEEPGEDGRRALFYHLLPTITHSGHSSIGGVWALSFSQTPPPNGSPNHKTVLGVLPATQAKAGNTATRDPPPAPSIGNFEQNPHFVQTLHQAIRHVLDSHADETLEAEAKARGEGWMHICDKRIAPTLNRIPDPEDIIGSVMVENGKTLPDSYQAMPSYRVVSGENGPMALSEAIQSELTRLQKE